MLFAFEKTARISLSCTLVPVQYREYYMTYFNIDDLPWFIEDYLRIGLVFNALLTGFKIFV